MEYSVETTHGESETTYKFTIDDPLQGVGQGSGHSSPIWNFTSSIIITVNNKGEMHLVIKDPQGNIIFERNVASFVDDSGLYRNIFSQIPIYDITNDLREWLRNLHITGGDLQLIKTILYNYTGI